MLFLMFLPLVGWAHCVADRRVTMFAAGAMVITLAYTAVAWVARDVAVDGWLRPPGLPWAWPTPDWLRRAAACSVARGRRASQLWPSTE